MKSTKDKIKHSSATDGKPPVMRWMAYPKTMPEIGYENQVLVYCLREHENKMEVIQAWHEEFGFCSMYMREDEDIYVTHWMPLPKPPCA